MPLKVTSQQNPVVKVTDNYAKAVVTVSKNYGTQVGANPQLQAGAKAVQSTARPQTTATAKQINAAKVAQDWATKEATRLRQEADQRAYEKLQATTAFNSDLATHKKNWLDKTVGKLGFAGVLAGNRRAKDASIKYNDLNSSGFSDYEAAQRHAQRLIDARRASTDVTSQSAIDSYNNWLDSMNKWSEDTANKFNKTRAELDQKQNAPNTGKTATGLAVVAKYVSKIGQPAAWAFNKSMQAVEIPSRLISMARNEANPNRTRLYYGGTEKTGKVSGSLRQKFDATKDQRIVGMTAADEAKYNAELDAMKIPAIARFFGKGKIKYADDFTNQLVDPTNWVGAGEAAKALKLLKVPLATKFLGKITKPITNNRLVKGLNREVGQNPMTMINQALRDSRLADAAKTNDKYLKVLAGHQQVVDEFNDLRKVTNAGKRAQISSKIDDQFTRFSDSVTKATEQTKFYSSLANLNQKQVDVLKRMSNGRISPSDRLWALNHRKDYKKIIEIDKQQSIYDLARVQSDNVTHTRFGGQGKQYWSQAFTNGEAQYDFTKTRKNNDFYHQTPEQFSQSQITRQFESDTFFKSLTSPKISATHRTIVKNLISQNRDMKVSLRKQLAAKNNFGDVTPEKFYNKFFGQTGNLIGDARGNLRDIALNKENAKAREANLARYAAKQNPQLARRMATNNLSVDALNEAMTSSKSFKFANSKTGKVIGTPLAQWRKLVTKYTPSWYTGNAISNQISGTLAGGFGFLGQQVKHLNPFIKKDYSSLPKGVASDIGKGLGLGKVSTGTKVENAARIPLFKSFKKKGFNDTDALKLTNDWLLSYKTKNWERPFKTVVPFWSWSKGMTVLGATMAFKNPRGTNVINQFNKQFSTRPYDATSDSPVDFTDASGNQIQFDRKEVNKGKYKLPFKRNGEDQWLSLGSNPYTPEAMSRYPINPFISAATDWGTGIDRFGNRVKDEKQIVASRYSPARMFYDATNTPVTTTNNRLTGKGYGKSTTKDSLLPKMKNDVLSVFGIPKVTGYDAVGNAKKLAISKANKEIFDPEYQKQFQRAPGTKYDPTAWSRKQASDKAIAEKYGLTIEQLQKSWDADSTPTAVYLKKVKHDQQANTADLWTKYWSLPKEQRNAFLSDPANRDMRFSLKPHATFTANGKYFKSAASRDRYIAGATKYANRKKPIQFDGKYFKTQATADKYKAGKIKYETARTSPKMAFERPTTKAGWDALKLTIKVRKQTKLRAINGFSQSEARLIKQFKATHRVKFTRGIKITTRV